jgi:hypothetical protein
MERGGRAERGMRGRDRTPGGRGGRNDDVPRSSNPLLDEFKSSKSRKIEMKVRLSLRLAVAPCRAQSRCTSVGRSPARPG